MSVRVDLDPVNDSNPPNQINAFSFVCRATTPPEGTRGDPMFFWWNASALYWAIFARFPLLNHIYSEVGWVRHGLPEIDWLKTIRKSSYGNLTKFLNAPLEECIKESWTYLTAIMEGVKDADACRSHTRMSLAVSYATVLIPPYFFDVKILSCPKIWFKYRSLMWSNNSFGWPCWCRCRKYVNSGTQ